MNDFSNIAGMRKLYEQKELRKTAFVCSDIPLFTKRIASHLLRENENGAKEVCISYPEKRCKLMAWTERKDIAMTVKTRVWNPTLYQLSYTPKHL